MTTYDSRRSSALTNYSEFSRTCRSDALEALRRPPPGEPRFLRGSRFVCITAAILATFCQVAVSQKLSMPVAADKSSARASVESICSPDRQDAAKAALQLVCQKEPLVPEQSLSSQTIVIGFVGGFASPHDLKHPEVLFAVFLRRIYASRLHAKVFSNHDRNGALQYVFSLLDTNGDGILSDDERKSARIIIFGHSWGASETVAFARTLGRYSIPVLLTVQLDTVGKWGQRPSRISSNVASAINFYQSEGFLRGRPEIVAADKTRTEIIGNFRFTYVEGPISCNNYPWFARTFNKPHHEIENDPRVWDQVASLIDSRIASNGGTHSLSLNVGTGDSGSAFSGTAQDPAATNVTKMDR